VAVHQDRSLPVEEKCRRVDELVHAAPPDVLDRLPLPPPFHLLPEAERLAAKFIFADPSIDYKVQGNLNLN
jgi:hypothetical protein